jgi:hypothetical protein
VQWSVTVKVIVGLRKIFTSQQSYIGTVGAAGGKGELGLAARSKIFFLLGKYGGDRRSARRSPSVNLFFLVPCSSPMQVPMVGLATFFSDFSGHVTMWAEPKKYFFQSPKPNWLTLSQLHFFRKIVKVGSNVSNFKKNKICTKVAFSHFSPIELFIPRRLVQVPCR